VPDDSAEQRGDVLWMRALHLAAPCATPSSGSKRPTRLDAIGGTLKVHSSLVAISRSTLQPASDSSLVLGSPTTKDQGRKQEQKEGPSKDPQTKAPDQESETSGRDCEVVPRIGVDDTGPRAARAAPQGRNVRVVAIRALRLARLT
jgi:hypothetical protein